MQVEVAAVTIQRFVRRQILQVRLRWATAHFGRVAWSEWEQFRLNVYPLYWSSEVEAVLEIVEAFRECALANPQDIFGF